MKKLFRNAALAGLVGTLCFGILSAGAQTTKLDEVKKEALKLDQLNSLSPQQIIGRGISILMMFMGAIMFGLVVYGGILWMTANGNTEKISKAKGIIIWAALGVVVMLASYIVIKFIFDQLAAS